MLWCMAWAYGDARVPLSSFIIIVLIWPYQLYLQRRNK
ncbi:hypothetical protein [Caudoviricetes sp.]|nr:hypothetical protein [Caudoviricetes sp.]